MNKKSELNNYIEVLKMLLELSNQEEQKYSIKVYQTSELQSITTDMIDRTLTKENSHIWVLGLKETIEEIDEWGNIDDKGSPPIGYDPLEPHAFQYIFIKLINNNHSLIIMTDHSDEYRILPQKWKIQKEVSEVRFKTHPMLSDIYCYIYNDELGRAVQQLRNIAENTDEDVKTIKKIYRLNNKQIRNQNIN